MRTIVSCVQLGSSLLNHPAPIYCTPCGACIKQNAMYYTMGATDTQHVFCNTYYNEARGDTIVVYGTAIPKARLEEHKNEKIEE